MHISEAPKFLETPNETPHAVKLVDPFEAAHPLIICTSYVVLPVSLMYSPQELQDMKIKISQRFTWDPSTTQYSEQKTQMLDHPGQILIPATCEKGPVFVSTFVSLTGL